MRRLRDLRSVGPATVRDLARLGIHDVDALARHEAIALYERLGQLDGAPHDPCVLDVLRCAVAQAQDPALPAVQRDWFWWSRLRKSGKP
ncbi:helix-hairpin-helix domain-containing protein [Nitratidesulfovibrio vulgaris]|uniref:helix-hairpin-helix domain-containing protein n=1 Tax=Nitratidesulfovibrio vulgaris TaxID=881 RepID=UPI0013E0B37C|nr:helix-hairpin-helix domain-containing protein [Nitratidesulfovibrio vulgaris]